MMKNRCIGAVLAAAALSSSAAAQERAPDCGLYTYQAEIVRVVDGDTVVANVNLGFNTWRHGENLRLVGIDTPERGKEGANEATEALMLRDAQMAANTKVKKTFNNRFSFER